MSESQIIAKVLNSDSHIVWIHPTVSIYTKEFISREVEIREKSGHATVSRTHQLVSSEPVKWSAGPPRDFNLWSAFSLYKWTNFVKKVVRGRNWYVWNMSSIKSTSFLLDRNKIYPTVYLPFRGSAEVTHTLPPACVKNSCGGWFLIIGTLGLFRFLPATFGWYSLIKSVISVGVDNV